MSKKMTKREMFEVIKTRLTDANEIAFIDHEIELLAKKNTTERKPTAQQMANEGIKEAILNGMEANRYYTISEMMKVIPACAELSGQRISALVKQLKDAGLVTRTEDKRKAYFCKAN